MLESDDDEAEEEEALDDEVKEEAILLGVRQNVGRGESVGDDLGERVIQFDIEYYPCSLKFRESFHKTDFMNSSPRRIHNITLQPCITIAERVGKVCLPA